MPAKKAVTAPKTTKAAKPAAASSAAKAAPAKAASAAKPAAAAGAATAGKAAATPTMSMKQIATELAGMHDLKPRAAGAMLDDMVEIISRNLKKGARIRIGGLGILQVKKRAARMGRNPATGEQIKIKASKKVAFRPAKELKEFDLIQRGCAAPAWRSLPLSDVLPAVDVDFRSVHIRRG